MLITGSWPLDQRSDKMSSFDILNDINSPECYIYYYDDECNIYYYYDIHIDLTSPAYKIIVIWHSQLYQFTWVLHILLCWHCWHWFHLISPALRCLSVYLQIVLIVLHYQLTHRNQMIFTWFASLMSQIVFKLSPNIFCIISSSSLSPAPTADQNSWKCWHQPKPYISGGPAKTSYPKETI